MCVSVCLFVHPDPYLSNRWKEFLNIGHDDGLWPGHDAHQLGIPDAETKMSVSKQDFHVMKIDITAVIHSQFYSCDTF